MASSGVSSSGSAVTGVIPFYARSGALLPCPLGGRSPTPLAYGLPGDDARNFFSLLFVSRSAQEFCVLWQLIRSNGRRAALRRGRLLLGLGGFQGLRHA